MKLASNICIAGHGTREQILLVAPYFPNKSWFLERGRGQGPLYEVSIRPEISLFRELVFFPWEGSSNSFGIGSVFSFPRQGLSASTLKVCVATIAANHDILDGRSVRKYILVIMVLFHCVVRLGSAWFRMAHHGSVRLGLRFHCSLVPF